MSNNKPTFTVQQIINGEAEGTKYGNITGFRCDGYKNAEGRSPSSMYMKVDGQYVNVKSFGGDDFSQHKNQFCELQNVEIGEWNGKPDIKIGKFSKVLWGLGAGSESTSAPTVKKVSFAKQNTGERTAADLYDLFDYFMVTLIENYTPIEGAVSDLDFMDAAKSLAATAFIQGVPCPKKSLKPDLVKAIQNKVNGWDLEKATQWAKETHGQPVVTALNEEQSTNLYQIINNGSFEELYGVEDAPSFTDEDIPF
jgi:hypothetical protein